jgi:DNA repair ATPase RecN
LLENPEGLWNVVVVNGSWRLASTSKRDPLEYQTPLAQFVRGICSAVISQRTNILPILHELEEQLRDSEDDNLFDDRQFSKSRTYHWIIKTCHDICTSIQISLKFLTDFRTSRLPELSRKAHGYERTGVEYWTMKLGEEISELDKMQTEINALREQVRELVSSQSPNI